MKDRTATHKKLYGAVWARHVKANAAKIKDALVSGIEVKSHSGGRLGSITGVYGDGWCQVTRDGKPQGVTRFGNEVHLKRLGEGFVVLDHYEAS